VRFSSLKQKAFVALLNCQHTVQEVGIALFNFLFISRLIALAG
jgi:hypothetical protein